MGAVLGRAVKRYTNQAFVGRLMGYVNRMET
jgi:hypothetical protein